MQDQLDRIEKKVDRLDEAVRGDGKSGGIVTRLDRVEQAEKRRASAHRTAKGALVAAIGACAAAITALLKHQ